MTATRCPLYSGFSGSFVLCSMCQSATNRSRRPIPTDSPFTARTQRSSHWVSCGHTRPQTAGRQLVVFMISYASSNSPAATLVMNSGIRTLTGQPATQGLFLQLRQRVASSIAISLVYPRETSLKFLFLTSGSCSGIGTFLRDILAILLSS